METLLTPLTEYLSDLQDRQSIFPNIVFVLRVKIKGAVPLIVHTRRHARASLYYCNIALRYYWITALLHYERNRSQLTLEIETTLVHYCATVLFTNVLQSYRTIELKRYRAIALGVFTNTTQLQIDIGSFGTGLLEASHVPVPLSTNTKGVSRWRCTHEIKHNTNKNKKSQGVAGNRT